MTIALFFSTTDPAAPDRSSGRDRDPQRLRAAEQSSADADLVARVQAGDATAFEHMVHAYYPDLCAYVVSITNDRGQAEELVQDLFFNIWRLGARWTVRGSLASYLYMSARHAALRMAARNRRGAQWAQHGDASEVHGAAPVAPDVTVARDDLNVAIARAVAALPPRSREAFILTRRSGMTYLDVARVMGVSVKTVETHVRLALQTLRERLAPWLP